MTVVFNPNIPQSSDDPTNSQVDLLNNFTKLNLDWAVNHINLVAGGNNGFHTKVNFPNVLGSDPTLVNQQSEIYPKIGPDSLPALFFANASNVYQLTKLPVVTSGTNYGIVTPWGMTLNAGKIIGSSPLIATFAIPFVNGNFYFVSASSQILNTVAIGSITNTQITLNTGTNPAVVYYMVIGN